MKCVAFTHLVLQGNDLLIASKRCTCKFPLDRWDRCLIRKDLERCSRIISSTATSTMTVPMTTTEMTIAIVNPVFAPDGVDSVEPGIACGVVADEIRSCAVGDEV